MREVIFEQNFPVHPVPLARPRLSGSYVYTPRECQNAKAMIGTLAKSKYKLPLQKGALAIEARFVHKRPKRIKTDGRVPKDTIPDTDNLLKLLLDALEGIIYKNDKQFCKFIVEDWFAAKDENPHIYVKISRVIV